MQNDNKDQDYMCAVLLYAYKTKWGETNVEGSDKI